MEEADLGEGETSIRKQSGVLSEAGRQLGRKCWALMLLETGQLSWSWLLMVLHLQPQEPRWYALEPCAGLDFTPAPVPPRNGQSRSRPAPAREKSGSPTPVPQQKVQSRSRPAPAVRDLRDSHPAPAAFSVPHQSRMYLDQLIAYTN